LCWFSAVLFSFCGCRSSPFNETTNELSRGGHGKDKILKIFLRFTTGIGIVAGDELCGHQFWADLAPAQKELSRRTRPPQEPLHLWLLKDTHFPVDMVFITH
jgi:hypothetical protein